MGRQARARRSPDFEWAHGRRLVLIDVENVVGGPCSTEACARWARRRLEDELGPFGEQWADQVWVGVDAGGLRNVAWEWRNGRPLEGYGADGADRALLELLTDDVPRRFERVLIASGDGIFADAGAALAGRGVHLTVVAHECGLNRRLRASATEVVLLSRVGDCSPADLSAGVSA